MRLRLLLVLCLCPFLLRAQLPTYRLGHVRLWDSFNVNRLAHALTDGLPDDSLKVKSIYLWMTHHIRYDVRAFSLGRSSHVSPNAILFYRKTVCLGYSILFDSLCKIAGINAVVVPGYVYEPWYEARDTLYLDTHAWNAVEVDGEWKLLDITWASGIVKMRHQYFAKTMQLLFHIPYQQKLKYVKKRNDNYYFPPPEKFVLDHLPSSPAWQLLDCSVPLDSFQWSPQATQHYLDNPVNCKNGFDSIPALEKTTERRYLIAEGKQAVHYNKNNHQDLALGYWMNGILIFEDANDTNRSYEQRLKLYDSVMVQMDSARLAFLATSRDSKNEGDYFVRRNARMKKQLIGENKPLIKKHSIEYRKVTRDRMIARKTINHLERQNKQLKFKSKIVHKKKIIIERPDGPMKNEEEYRESLEEAIQSNDEAIAAYEDSISFVTYNLNANEPITYTHLVKRKKELLQREMMAQRYTLFYRQFSYNSFDTVLINQKKIIFKCENKMDTLNDSLRPAGTWIVDSSAALYNKYVKEMDVLMKQNMQYCQRLGKINKAGFNEKQYYKDMRKKYVAYNDSLIAQNKLRIAAYENYIEELDKMSGYYTSLQKSLQKEMNIENGRAAASNSFFKTYYGGYAKNFRQGAQTCMAVKKYAQQNKQQLIKQHQKKLRDAAKKKK